jgi:AAA domain
MGTRTDLVRDHPALIESIRTQTGGKNPCCVVLDTLNRSLRGSESKDEDMGAYVDAADAIREAFDCAVIIVHHCGVDGSRPRGHTSLGGAVDVQLAVTRTDDKITVKVEWMKDGPEGDVIWGQIERVELGTDEDGDPLDSCVVVPLDPSVAQTSAPKKELPQIPRAALRFLWECVAESGRAAPPSSHIPGKAKGVTLDEWKSHLLKAGVINEKGNPREQFKRIHVTLQNAGLIGVWEGFVWPVT